MVATASPDPITKTTAGAAGALAGAARIDWSPGLGRSAVTAKEAVKRRLLEAVNEVLGLLRSSCGQRLLILADGLDPMAGIEEVKQVLSEPRLLTELECTLVLGP